MGNPVARCPPINNFLKHIFVDPDHKESRFFVARARYYAPQDLFLGAEVPLVTGHTLIVTEMDRSSLSLCEENAQEFPLMDSGRVLGRIAQRARNMRLALRR